MERTGVAFTGLAVLVIASLPVADVRAEVYTYTDEDGVVHFTNVPTDERFQRYSRTKIIRDTADGIPVITNRGVGEEPAPRKKRRAKVRARDPRRGAERYAEIIRAASRRFNVPIALITAVIRAESAYDPRAVSRAGAKGLMQLMPATATDMGVADVFDPEQNIFGGTRYLRFLANKFDGDMVLTVAAYNGGPSNVRRYGYIPPFEETQKYVGRVLRYYYEYKENPLL